MSLQFPRKFSFITAVAFIILVCQIKPSSSYGQNKNSAVSDLYHFRKGFDMRWSSPENPNGLKGQGGKINKGAKGRAYVFLYPGKNIELLNFKGQGIIQRIWITISNDWQDPETLRSLRFDIYWDGQDKPAVSVPLGDFFGAGLGKQTVFENVFFANPEGKSFNCFIPMPFRTGARIVLTNETTNKKLDLYYDVDFSLTDQWDNDNLYFHAYWHRDTATVLTKDFEILPFISGRGRFLGSNIGVNGNRLYESNWFGEGEVKIYKDGDREWPTLAGTGTEDYIGTGWGQKRFYQTYTGCTYADTASKQWAFYRYHVIDPIFFNQDVKVTIQQMGGAWMSTAIRLQQSKVPLVPVTVENESGLFMVFDKEHSLKLELSGKAREWANFYRSDDVSAVAYFYLDKPTDSLPPLQPLAIRIAQLR